MPIVWIVNPFDSLPLEGCRPQRYWLMAGAFAAAGCRVRLWSSDFNHVTKRRREVRTGGDGFAVELLPTMPYGANVCLARVRSHLKLAATFSKRAHEAIDGGERPAIVIASTPPLVLCSTAMRIAHSCGAAFVCDIQDAWPETFLRLFPGCLRWIGGLLLMPLKLTARRLYREADFVTGVCRRYAALSGRNDFYLAYHGIEPDQSASAVDGNRRKNALVYIGNLGAGYDLECIIRAVSSRASLSLDIAGLGPQESRLRQLVGELRLEGRVRFHGFLSATALQNLLASCDVGVIPMRDDSWVGLPYKLGDYLKAGLGIVSSLNGECGELLLATGTGRTYEWGSSDSLLAALDALPNGKVALPDALRADRIYPKYVAVVKSALRKMVY